MPTLTMAYIWIRLVQKANFPNLLQRRKRPLVVVLQLFDALVQPDGLLRVPFLRAGIVEYFDVRRQCLIHDFRRNLVGMGQIPKQHQHLVRHDAVFVILRESANELQQFLPLLFVGGSPARLRIYLFIHIISEILYLCLFFNFTSTTQ